MNEIKAPAVKFPYILLQSPKRRTQPELSETAFSEIDVMQAEPDMVGQFPPSQPEKRVSDEEEGSCAYCAEMMEIALSA